MATPLRKGSKAAKDFMARLRAMKNSGTRKYTTRKTTKRRNGVSTVSAAKRVYRYTILGGSSSETHAADTLAEARKVANAMIKKHPREWVDIYDTQSGKFPLKYRGGSMSNPPRKRATKRRNPSPWVTNVQVRRGGKKVTSFNRHAATKAEAKKLIADAVKAVPLRSELYATVERDEETVFEGGWTKNAGWSIHTDERLGFREKNPARKGVRKATRKATRKTARKRTTRKNPDKFKVSFRGMSRSDREMSYAEAKRHADYLSDVHNKPVNIKQLVAGRWTIVETVKSAKRRNPPSVSKLGKRAGSAVARGAKKGLQKALSIPTSVLEVGKDTITMLMPAGSVARIKRKNPGLAKNIKKVVGL